MLMEEVERSRVDALGVSSPRLESVLQIQFFPVTRRKKCDLRFAICDSPEGGAHFSVASGLHLANSHSLRVLQCPIHQICGRLGVGHVHHADSSSRRRSRPPPPPPRPRIIFEDAAEFEFPFAAILQGWEEGDTSNSSSSSSSSAISTEDSTARTSFSGDSGVDVQPRDQVHGRVHRHYPERVPADRQFGAPRRSRRRPVRLIQHRLQAQQNHRHVRTEHARIRVRLVDDHWPASAQNRSDTHAGQTMWAAGWGATSDWWPETNVSVGRRRVFEHVHGRRHSTSNTVSSLFGYAGEDLRRTAAIARL